jgi:hypothetical protein
MNPPDKALFLMRGRLTVLARGYWFTAGGEKGSFGYYPHLKDSDGYPLYPDTQVHGDLKMAADWIAGLEGGMNKALAARVFGKSEGGIAPSLLRVTDLRVSAADREKLRAEDIFQIKPRIWIDDKIGTVRKGMLVYREMAWLDGLTLEADIYIGYSADRSALERACRMVMEAGQFISGFGGHRSRGYGRGQVQVHFAEPERVIGTDGSAERADGEFNYFARALINFRNKGVSQSSSMQVKAQSSVSAQQLRGWFVRVYHDLYNEWPTDKQMATIGFPELYPAVVGTGGAQLAWPVAGSTMKYTRSGRIQDLQGSQKGDEKNDLDGKPKPLGQGWYVTDGASPQAFQVRIQERFRNRTDTNFATVLKGLIVQELIPAGTVFGGRVTIAAADSDFGRRAGAIFQKAKLEVNGCLFEPTLEKVQTQVVDLPGAYLVVSPVHYVHGLKREKDQVRLAVTRSYSTILKRPRRNRIIVAPGSVIAESIPGKTVQWAGFKKEIACAAPVDSSRSQFQQKSVPSRPAWYPGTYSIAGSLEITRAQTGLLREFLQTSIDRVFVEKILTDRRDKHKKDENEENKRLVKLDEACLACLKGEKNLDKLQEFIKLYLEDVALHRWEKRHANGGGNEVY